MFGLQISERFYRFYGREMIRKYFPGYEERIAAGLVGEGSDCFGFDDEISRDHDWGPAFCIWLNREDFLNVGEEMQKRYDDMPEYFAGIPVRKGNRYRNKRYGIFEINEFYRAITGFLGLPTDWREWLSIPEYALAACTNGKVFDDPAGEFSSFRQELLKYYPEQVRIKKIADCAVIIAREGQHNFQRCVKRNDLIASFHAKALFNLNVINMTYMLNYSYMPFYKWMGRGLEKLPLLGSAVLKKLNEINYGNRDNCFELIDQLCYDLIIELRKQGLTNSTSPYMLDHAGIILGKISDIQLRDFQPGKDSF